MMVSETLFSVIGVAASLGAALVAFAGSRAFRLRREERLAALETDILAMLRMAAGPRARPAVTARRAARKSA